MKKINLTICIMHLAFCISFAQSGTLDSSWGTNGEVVTGFGGYYELAESVVIQSDGKIIAAGSSIGANGAGGGPGIFALARYNSADGSLDNTFGNGGIVNTQFVDGNFYYAHSAAIQSDGKIVLAGHRCDTTTNSYCTFALARYNTDGSLNNSFGDYPGQGRSVAIQTDGKIVVAGTSGSQIALLRYTTVDGHDNTFGTNGVVTTAVGTGNAEGASVAIQSDGKILVAGGGSDFVLIRYNNDGSLDGTFGAGGIATVDFGSSEGELGKGIVIQTDGKIIVAGMSGNGVALARYNSNGSLDNSFGSGGKVITVNAGGDRGNSVALQSDGKIVVGGVQYYNSNPTSDFALFRYNSNGSLDNTFGSGGIATAHFYMGDEGSAIAIQSDGKIIEAGSVGYTDGTRFVVARFNNSVASGIAEAGNSNEQVMKIYPNPSSGKFIIESSEKNSSLAITNILGETVFGMSVISRPSSVIDLSNQPKGIYFLEAITGEERRTRKIILE